MKNSIIALLALLTVPVSLFGAPQLEVKASQCSINQTPIGVRFPKNPDSYNNFAYTQGKVFCVNNSTINGTSSTATPTLNKRARYALKILTNPTPTIGVPGLFRPFNYTATNVCTATQNALGIKFSLTTVLPSTTAVTVKFCRGLMSGGIGDDARMQQAIKQTLYYYYLPAINPANILVKRSNGTNI